MKNVKLRWIVALAVLLLIASVQWSVRRTSPDTGSAAATDVAMNVVQASRQVLEALRARDGDRLAELTHPTKGVRFSPYAYVDMHKDRVFFKEQIRRFWDDRTIYMWGHADASGEPIALTAAAYCERYVLDRNYHEATFVSVNADRSQGNTVNNAAEVYPQGIRVEYYIEPPPGEGVAEFGWSALRLVFEDVGGGWFLVAIIHDQWTT